jgi:hypothetical protein
MNAIRAMLSIGLLLVLVTTTFHWGCGESEPTPPADGGADATSDAAADAPPASGTQRYSCDVGTGGARLCQDTVYPESLAEIVGQVMAMCESGGGTLGDTCDTTGSVGGCRNVNGETITTAWYYSGSEAEVTQRCQEQMDATFVMP